MVSTMKEVDMMEEKLDKRVRRRHEPELKQQVVAACRRPDASVAAVALAHGLNANMVHRWLGESTRNERQLVAVAGPTFTPLPLKPTRSGEGEKIHLELRRGSASVTVNWPVTAAGACGVWLHEWLR